MLSEFISAQNLLVLITAINACLLVHRYRGPVVRNIRLASAVRHVWDAGSVRRRGGCIERLWSGRRLLLLRRRQRQDR